jgi:hypothetical protein
MGEFVTEDGQMIAIVKCSYSPQVFCSLAGGGALDPGRKGKCSRSRQQWHGGDCSCSSSAMVVTGHLCDWLLVSSLLLQQQSVPSFFKDIATAQLHFSFCVVVLCVEL